MIGIDTNIILRVFIDDNEAQVAAVAKLLAGRGPASIRLTNVVIAEFVWTLMRRYKREKADIIDVLEQLLQREELVFENRNALMTALGWYASGPADFVDYLVGALNEEAGASTTFTFDQDAADHAAFSLVTP